jgi:hypothetical protein
MERCFSSDPDWSLETVEYVKTNSQLNYVQIYKWGWDQKKKVENNPDALKVATIDEFGGYCKFSSNDHQPLDKLIDEDLNNKVLLLVRECEKELGPLPDFEPNENQVEKIMSNYIQSECDLQKDEPKIKLVEISDEDSIVSCNKKTKRERYCSDLTNATRSGLQKHEPLHNEIALLMGHCNSSPLVREDPFDRFFNYEVPSVKYEDYKVSYYYLPV